MHAPVCAAQAGAFFMGQPAGENALKSIIN